MSRSNESPMDFQWQQGFGPSGPDSPFIKSTISRTMGPNGPEGAQRPAQTPSIPSFSMTKSQPAIFRSTPSIKSTQYRTLSFTTPQRPVDFDFSSGPENQSSPANGDTEDTPEPPTRHQRLTNDGSMVQFQSEKKQSIPGFFGRYGASGRGEIQRRHPNDTMARRIYKRKRRELERDVRIIRRRPSEGSDSEAEDQGRPSTSEGAKYCGQGKNAGIVSTFFSYLETHPNLPHILSYYTQFLLNFFLVGFLMYMIYAFWSTIRSDINEKSKEAASEILVEMAMCAEEFKNNKCDKHDTRVPAMESVCNSWQRCMQRDPTMVGRAKVSAHTFAEIINNFFQPISAKAMISLVVLFLGCLAVNNFTMYLFRQRIHPPQPNFQHVNMQPQPTPSRYRNYSKGEDHFDFQHRSMVRGARTGNEEDKPPAYLLSKGQSLR